MPLWPTDERQAAKAVDHDQVDEDGAHSFIAVHRERGDAAHGQRAKAAMKLDHLLAANRHADSGRPTDQSLHILGAREVVQCIAL